MDIQAEKIQLIEWLVSLNKPSIIKKLVSLKKKETDWWDEISAQEKAEIEEGLSQADRGQLVPHAKVMERYKKWPLK
jgi:hypothetical protein